MTPPLNPNDPASIRARLALAADKIVGNKMVIFDALLQCREDYMAAAEHAIEQHKYWRADTQEDAGLRQKMIHDFAVIIGRSQTRLEMLHKAMAELE